MLKLENPVLIQVGVAIATVAAFAAVALQAPVGVRIVASAVLVIAPGIGLARLLLPRREIRGSDGALVIPLSIVLGMLVWLGAAMGLHAFGVKLGPTAIALTLTGVGLILAGLAIRSGVRRPEAVREAPAVGRYRTAAAVVTTAALLTGATAAAIALIPTPTAPYTTVAFTDDTPFGDRVPVAAAGSTVRLEWVVRGFGQHLSPALTSVRLAVDGVPISDVAVDMSPDTTDASASISGAVTFPAPVVPGRHIVDLFVQPTAQDGSDVPGPGYVSTPLEVTA
ncbi:hypothetical protein D8S82_12000 [Mycobacterium hodleri]|uniref:DUF1616 domain-containing protein n=1 Tax=Mycolicibacterium hodleri TaxID=49897 RepID=A0A544W257_9MYCO|nr:hypothetical protein [Mycolicibacterium hodleri]TQR86300.1 hypothetical protein D8S82_12000 [Mycolicibacterium hodleri]